MFVTIKLNKEIVKGMISTYECLLHMNKGCDDDVKEIRKIIKALKISLL